MAGDVANLLDLIIDRAPRLRAAGVSSVELAGVRFAMLPPEAPAAAEPVDDDDLGTVDALNDPTTFGRRRNVPGRRKEVES